MKFIQKYKTIENLIESTEKITIPDEFKNKYIASRGLFKVFDGKIDLENLPINNSVYDGNAIYKYLVNDCDNALAKNSKFITEKL